MAQGKRTKVPDGAEVDRGIVVKGNPYGIMPDGMALLADGEVEKRSRSCLANLGRVRDQVLLSVLEFLDGNSLAQFSATCTRAYAFAQTDHLWRTLTLSRDWGCPLVFGRSWRSSFIAMSRGVEGNDAIAAIDAQHSPIRVSGVYSDTLYEAYVAACAEPDTSWNDPPRRRAAAAGKRAGPATSIPTIHCPSPEEFRTKFDEPGLPVVITGVASEWPATKKWSQAFLERQFGDAEFTAGGFNFTLSSYFRYMSHTRDDQRLYIFDKEFPRRAPAMLGDFEKPALFGDDLFATLGARRPDWQWIIIGPTLSGSTFHVDPNGTSALNAVISGRKKWVFFPPGQVPPGVHSTARGEHVIAPMTVVEWLIHFLEPARAAGALECTAGPGDIVFVPRGWWHLVVNLEPTVAITQNFVTEPGLNAAMYFLRNRRDQVSGVAAEEAGVLAEAFASALQQKRPKVWKRWQARDAAQQAAKRAAAGSMKRSWGEVVGAAAAGGDDGANSDGGFRLAF